MKQRKTAFKERLQQNSKNYSPRTLLDLDALKDMLEQFRKNFGLDTVVTDRHGTIVMTIGDFGDFKPDVVNHPGNKIRVKGRTVCHIYAKYDNVAQENTEAVKNMLAALIKILENTCESTYISSEQTIYIDELEKILEKNAKHGSSSDGEQKDPLTGTLSRNAFLARLKKLQNDEVVPTACIVANINDWSFFDNNYGEDESDRLIVEVVNILEQAAKETGFSNAVIGRIEGDVFYIAIPLAEHKDAVQYCDKVREIADKFEDDILVPSIALGFVVKINVESKFKEVFSDAEYEMLENKFEIKNAPGYKEKREKGLRK